MLTEAERQDDLRATVEMLQLERRLAGRVIELRRGIKSLQAELDEGVSVSRVAPEIAHLRYEIYRVVSEATHDHFSPGDVAMWVEHCRSMDATIPAFDANTIRALIYYRRVPNVMLRAATKRETDSGVPLGRIAEGVKDILERMEHEDDADYGSSALAKDSNYKYVDLALARQLGLDRERSKGKWVVRCFIRYEFAAALAEYLGLTPAEIGI